VSSRRRWIVWSVYVVLWTIALVAPIPAPVTRTFQEVPLVKIALAKSLHFLAYALLAGLSAWLRLSLRGRILLLFFVMFHASATELVQFLVGYRGGQVIDVVLDQAGILLGLIATWKWWTEAR